MKTKGYLVTSGMVLFFSALLLISGLGGCSSGSGRSDTALSAAEGTVGSVGIVLTDGPADEYDHIYITITEISLLPNDENGEPVVIFQSTEGYEVDLLSLRDKTFLLTLEEDIPAGTYEKIRMYISEIYPVGGPCEELELKLPSGKVDINPQGEFIVEPGQNLYILLDIDADQSIDDNAISIHQAGKSGKCIFRPVVFGEILTEFPQVSCLGIHEGIIRDLTDSDEDGFPEEFLLGRTSDSIGGLRVILTETTRYVSLDSVYVDSDYLVPEQRVTVLGRIDEYGHIQASLVIVGDSLALEGMVLDGVVASEFPVAFSPGQGIVGDAQVVLLDETFIISGCDTISVPEDIIPGDGITLVGRYFASDEDRFRALAVFLPEAPTPR
ncbi:MAG: DUF4382 domain-containing protein [Desulfomonilia bacterium]